MRIIKAMQFLYVEATGHKTVDPYFLTSGEYMIVPSKLAIEVEPSGAVLDEIFLDNFVTDKVSADSATALRLATWSAERDTINKAQTDVVSSHAYGNLYRQRIVDMDNRPVLVHWNRTRKIWVVSRRVKSSRRVKMYARSLVLDDVKFAVQQRGQERTLRTQQRNVHAFAKGVIIDMPVADVELVRCVEIKYNPYFAPYFYDPQRTPVAHASRAVFLENGDVYAVMSDVLQGQ